MSSTTSELGTTGTRSAPLKDLNALQPRVLYTAYHVDDIDRALAFYVGVLGMQEQLRMPLGKGEHEAILGFPNSKSAGVILMWNTERKKPFEHGDAYSRVVLSVSDIEAALAHLKANGTEPVVPLNTAGTFRYAIVKDPDGYLVELLQVIKKG
jgi:lactoylglutathione lyase